MTEVTRFEVGQTVLTPIGRRATIVRGPYRKYGEDCYDIVQPTDLGEPARYTHRYFARQLRAAGDDG
ncbi:hypothetical protein SEA_REDWATTLEHOG_97 [Gordonia phage RedWattleHog]|uniref:Uncharacterized protein n=1 Tax=Gordonia phage Stormageddon TaxID=2656541 RepID=A0A649VR60_9CAUD|nr:hypothetical protein KHQ86_gp206 [Gordonia phage Stormageddon]QGJ94956.1 hypothetical protein SEA_STORMAGEDDON_94 [Gordonia phage Stormageddon]QLF83600.1 hypothetical protein SEA_REDWATTLEHOG_97 [Gordonia phage RedWattleHog]